jgi:ppGpp synthetase/RelA/SpoT-type nucleotidyltranferase
MSRGWIEPQFTASRVAAAGRRIRKGNPTEEDWQVFENWRRAHAYVLNTFQMRLRNVRGRFGPQVQIAQRHKRKPTIVDKLSREPSMQLSKMHDIAGCRAICTSISELRQFRDLFLNTRSKHIHCNHNSDRFDYIANPKESGYRGVHEVFEVFLDSESGSRWNGLKVELQFRTKAQHAWATAVETIDLLDGERAKFSQADGKLQRFFVVTSELIARSHESLQGALVDINDKDLVKEFKSLDKELGILRRLGEAVSTKPRISKGRNTILIFHYGGDQRLEIKSYESITPAQQDYSELERKLEGLADVVLVKAQHAEDLQRAFQNYFTDASDFVELVKVAHSSLG